MASPNRVFREAVLARLGDTHALAEEAVSGAGAAVAGVSGWTDSTGLAYPDCRSLFPAPCMSGSPDRPARVAWTPTGTNVPDYPKLAQLWWKNVAVAVTGEKTPQAAMDSLADEMDQVMGRLQRAGMKNYAGPTCKTEYQMCMKSCKPK